MEKVIYDIGVSSPVAPAEALPPLPAIPPGAVVVVTGRAPIWRYGRAFHALHGSPAGVVATFDPRLGGGVVVASHVPGIVEGEVIPLEA